MADLIVANPSLGDALAYTLPVAASMNKPNLLATNLVVENLLRSTPYFGDHTNGDRIIFTGGPGWHLKPAYCQDCPMTGRCRRCGKDATHQKQVAQLLIERSSHCFGEWYGFLRPLFRYVESDEVYRPRKIIQTWGLPWHPRLASLDLQWYSPWHMDFQCSERTLLLNLVAASEGRSLVCLQKELEAELKDWDVRYLDTARDVRSNVFLVTQVKHVVTVDTSTVWLAKYLGQTRLHVITPGALGRTCELGCDRFVTDNSLRYQDISVKHIKERLRSVLQQ